MRYHFLVKNPSSLDNISSSSGYRWNNVPLKDFFGLRAQIVQQNRYAKILVMNLAVILSRVAQAVAKRLYETREAPRLPKQLQ